MGKRRWVRLSLFRIATAFLVVMGILAGTGMVAPAAAQAATRHEFSHGEVLAWGGSWELQEDLTYIEGDLEIASLSTGRANLHVMAIPSNVSKSDIRDTFLDGFLGEVDNPVTIDRGDYGAVSYSLDVFGLNGVTFGGFMLLRESSTGGDTFGYFVVASADAFAATISDIQKRITLDGAGFFDGIDGAAMQEQLLSAEEAGTVPEATAATDDETPDATQEDGTETPEATAQSGEETPDATQEPSSDGGKFGGNKKKTPEPDATEDADVTPEAGNGKTGLISDNEYVSPQFGNGLTWDASWEVNPNSDEPIVSNEKDGYDRVSLVGTGDGLELMTVVFQQFDKSPTESFVDFWASPDGLDSYAFTPKAAEVIDQDSTATSGWIVVQDEYTTDSGDVIPIAIARGVTFDKETGVATLFLLTTTTVDFESSIDDCQSGIEADGEPALADIEPRDIVPNFT